MQDVLIALCLLFGIPTATILVMKYVIWLAKKVDLI